MMRQIASLVTEEEGYSWFSQAVISIYRDNGLLGFFSVSLNLSHPIGCYRLTILLCYLQGFSSTNAVRAVESVPISFNISSG